MSPGRGTVPTWMDSALRPRATASRQATRLWTVAATNEYIVRSFVRGPREDSTIFSLRPRFVHPLPENGVLDRRLRCGPRLSIESFSGQTGSAGTRILLSSGMRDRAPGLRSKAGGFVHQTWLEPRTGYASRGTRG